MFGLCPIDITNPNTIQNVCNIRTIFSRIRCDLVVKYSTVNTEGHWLDFSMGSVTLNSFKCQWQMDIASLKTEIVSLCVEFFFESFIEMFFCIGNFLPVIYSARRVMRC